MKIIIFSIIVFLTVLGLSADAGNLRLSIKRARKQEVYASPIFAVPIVLYFLGVCLLSVLLKLNGSYSSTIWLLVPVLAVVHLACLTYPFRRTKE